MSYLSNSPYMFRTGITLRNNIDGLGLGPEVEADLAGHGICMGITGAWVINFLGGAEGASRTSKFKPYFESVVRLQGAFLQFAHAIGPGHRVPASLGSIGYLNVWRERELKNLRSLAGILPREDSSWAVHLSIHHHDIGCGHLAGMSRYFIMDPEHGLYVYSAHSQMEQIVEEYRAHREKTYSQHKSCTAWVYYRRD